ncbi:MAG TPA: hypothetical protein VG756_28700 [Pseudonocardiaceae bacterium]|nr:hypothetical protein [Pseudonocardiaceae bacterium]
MRFQVLSLVAAAALSGFALAGCNASLNASTSDTGNGSASAPVQQTSPAASPSGQQVTTTGQQLQFPGKTLNVLLAGYDETTNMVQFQLARYVPAPTDNGGYEADPGNPGTHRLPLTANANVLSAADFCPGSGEATIGDDGLGTTPCSTAQFVSYLRSGGKDAAQLKVDGSDHIASVAEIYHP